MNKDIYLYIINKYAMAHQYTPSIERRGSN